MDWKSWNSRTAIWGYLDHHYSELHKHCIFGNLSTASKTSLPWTETNTFRLASHLYWTLWALIQVNTIELLLAHRFERHSTVIKSMYCNLIAVMDIPNKFWLPWTFLPMVRWIQETTRVLLLLGARLPLFTKNERKKRKSMSEIQEGNKNKDHNIMYPEAK